MDPRLWRRFDFLLLLATIALMGLGIVAISSATRGIPGDDLVHRQIIYAAAGLVIMLAAAILDYRLLGGLSIVVYIVTLAGLAVVVAYGRIMGGSQGWFDLGAFFVQPAELAKILVIVVMARFLSRYEARLNRFPYVAAALGVLVLPVALIYAQPDLGGAAVVFALGLALIWLAGLRWRHVLVMIAVVAILAPTIWTSLQPYMRERVLSHLQPDSDPDKGFITEQAIISIGAGGFLGQGIGHGSQSQLRFLRVRHTDFVFSVIAEELGFVGAMVLLLLMGFVLLRLLRIADLARDTYGRLIACGVAFIIFFQTFVNLGMNLKILPVTGVTLPFISYGGSSLLTLMLGLGLAESVAMRHRKLEF